MSRGNSDVRFAEQIRTLFQVGSLGSLPDGQLLDRFQSGDGECSGPAFAALVERHGPMVLGVCRRMLGDSHLAEDAFQATFLVLARRARSVRNREALGGWLHRVARRIALRSKDRADRRKTREQPGIEEVAVVFPSGIERQELRSIIDEEVDRLGDAQRLAVVLCCLEGLSHEEVSERLRWPLGTVKSRLARGRQRLQESLVRRGFAPSVVGASAAGSGLFGVEASAAVPPALVESTARVALTAVAVGGGAAGLVPAVVSTLVREELGSMILAKLKIAAGCLTLAAGASVAFIGFARAGGPAREPSEKVAAVAAPDQLQARGATKAQPPALAARLSASGRVVDSVGKAIAGATIILREWSIQRTGEMKTIEETEKLMKGGEIPDRLAATKTDADGQFRFQDVPAPAFPNRADTGKDFFPWDVVALAPGHALAWVHLTPFHQRTPILLTMGDESTIRGRIVEPGGKPVVGARVKVSGVDPLGRPDNGAGTDNRLNLSWSALPLGASTDADGRFIVRGLPRDKVIILNFDGPGHERLFAYAATTNEPQPDFVSPLNRSGKMTETRTPVHTGEFTLTARPNDHILTGRIVFESDDKPAPKARISPNMMTEVKVDADGRFRIEGLTAGKQEIHAIDFKSDAAPLDTEITIPETPKETEVTLKLPRGLILSGRVVDGTTGRGVEKVLLYYVHKYDGDETPSMYGFSEETDADGRYRLVVPAGRGTLDLRTIPGSFTQPERRNTGQPASPGFSREIDAQPGQEIQVADFKLSRGNVVTLRVLDPDGRPVANARVDIRDPNRLFNQTPGRTDAEGRYQASGLPPAFATAVDILAEGQPLGATIEIPGAETAVAKAGDLEIRLQPLVTLSGRVLDEEGKPLVAPRLILYRNVDDLVHRGRSFGTQAATLDGVEGDGSYTFYRLIPGATYNTKVEAGGHATSTSRHVKIKPGEPVRLEDFRLPALDQEVKGIVVDARGKPVAGVSVGYQRTDRTQAFYAPRDATWFLDTDATGRFHLTNLPRGAIRLQAYRRPENADQSIRNMKYVDVPPGQAEVRIELPDPNDRLRGID